MDHEFVTDGEEQTSKVDGEITSGSTSSQVVRVKSMHDDLVRACAMQGRAGPDSNQTNCRVVEQTWIPELIVRLGNEPTIRVFRDFEFKRASSTRIRFCVMDLKTRGAGVVCAFRWTDHFSYAEGRGWAHCISEHVSHECHAFRVERPARRRNLSGDDMTVECVDNLNGNAWRTS